MRGLISVFVVSVKRQVQSERGAEWRPSPALWPSGGNLVRATPA